MTEFTPLWRALAALVVGGAGTLLLVYVIAGRPDWAASRPLRLVGAVVAAVGMGALVRWLGFPPSAQVAGGLLAAAAFAALASGLGWPGIFDPWPRPYRWDAQADHAMEREREVRPDED